MTANSARGSARPPAGNPGNVIGCNGGGGVRGGLFSAHAPDLHGVKEVSWAPLPGDFAG